VVKKKVSIGKVETSEFVKTDYSPKAQPGAFLEQHYIQALPKKL
jgi:hypothetical protein